MKNKKRTTHIYPSFQFNIEEVAGAIGDFGTLFPIVLGVAYVSDVNFGHMLLFFSVWYIIIGLMYKMPVPVEPMKIIGAVTISLGLSKGEIAASGILLGALFLILGFFNVMKKIQKKIPKSVIRGIQAGLALILLKTSFKFINDEYLFAVPCILIIVIFSLLRKFTKVPDISALAILAVGVIAGILKHGVPPISGITIPELIIPTGEEFLKGGWLLAIPQTPLTVTNAILATSLLMQDLLNKHVDPDSLSKSIGLMNLLSAPFGGFPMCHGAGGLAAQYRFGARTGGSNIISGLILLIITLFFASPEYVKLISTGVFGALLVFVAIELGKHCIKTDSYLITGVTALVALFTNITIAFFVGLFLAYGFKKFHKTSR